MINLADCDAMALADLVRRKEVKPIELVDAAIDRIERLNPKLNAVVTPMYEQARAAAKGTISEGPFSGVPFLLKDLGAMYAGVRLTMGSKALSDHVPDHDNELVLRFKRAGLIILGKTNTPEFGLLPTTEPKLFGPAHNPWDLGRTPGGSSGGSAAAVAARLVPMAHGNDGGGSIRIPSSCCGLFGLKPTRGRTPYGPDLGDIMSGLAIEHGVTRSVRDSAALLDAISGPDIGDPYWAPPRERPFVQEVGADTGRLRIAFTSVAPKDISVHADCVAAVRDAASLCADLGHEVAEDMPAIGTGLDLVAWAFWVLWSSGCAWTINSLGLARAKTPEQDQYEKSTWAIYELGRAQTASDYLIALSLLQRVARDFGRFFQKYDAWLTPVLAEPPLPLGSFDPAPDDPLRSFLRAETFAPFTAVCNAAGVPAMSVPLFWNAEGLPIGVHFVGRFGNEAGLIRLAAQLESARPWADRKPSVSA